MYMSIHYLPLQVHCPSPNKCPGSFYKFKKYFESLNSQTVLHFCSNCLLQLHDRKGKCAKKKCINEQAKTCDLVLLPLENRLKQLYGKCKST